MPCPDPPRRQGRSPRGVPFPAMGKEPKDRPGHLPKGSPGPLLPAKGETTRWFPPLDPPSGDGRRRPRSSRQSGGFDGKRKSNQTHASIRGPYGNRDHEACEVHTDEACGGPPFFLPAKKAGKEKAPKGTFVVVNLAGIVFPVSERAGKTRKCSIAPPLRPEVRGFGAIMDGICGPLRKPSPTANGETARRFPHWILLPGMKDGSFAQWNKSCDIRGQPSERRSIQSKLPPSFVKPP